MDKYQISDILNEQKYHSFILVATSSKQLAQKWNYYVLSSNGQLLMNNQQKDENKHQINNHHQYLISIDSVAYQLGPIHKFILSQGNWLKQLFSLVSNPLQKQHIDNINQYGITRCQCLQIMSSLTFYYYVGKNNQYNRHDSSDNFVNQNQSFAQFVQIRPSYIFKNDCLLFQITNKYSQKLSIKQQEKLSTICFKDIQHYSLMNNKSHKNNQLKNQQYFYNFKSQYALLSDNHFLNCLVRGKKPICSYLRSNINQIYQFWIDPEIYSNIKVIYASSKI